MDNLRALFEDAIHQIGVYKHPNIDDATTALDSIIAAAGLGSIKHDKIERIYEAGGMVHVDTSWSVRNCAQTSSYSFPSAIVDAFDPIKAATIWGLEQKVTEARSRRDQYAAQVALYQQDMDKHIAKLNAIRAVDVSP